MYSNPTETKNDLVYGLHQTNPLCRKTNKNTSITLKIITDVKQLYDRTIHLTMIKMIMETRCKVLT